jgi:hypothetical protein
MMSIAAILSLGDQYGSQSFQIRSAVDSYCGRVGPLAKLLDRALVGDHLVS